MHEQLFDELNQTLSADGPAAAVDRLCDSLRERKDYGNLFYAMLLRKRLALGLCPVPTGASQDLPPSLHGAYEDAIREACQTVGRLFLDEGDVPRAWPYFRMLGETEPVARALETLTLVEGEDCQGIVDVAYHQGVHPRKGFELILERYGICNAITTLGGGHEAPFGPEVREHCIKRLVRALHQELRQRLSAEIAHREGTAPEAASIPEMIANRDWLFEDEFSYHIDVSHLGSVVQMATHLPPGEELSMARELCAYGRRLSPRFQYAADPPFEDQYRDYGLYLAALAGDDVEAALDHFRAKAAEADPQEVGTYPAEVLVNLLLRTGRRQEALTTARRYLADVSERPLTCPNLLELCERARDYGALAEVARSQDNPVHFMAGLIAAGRGKNTTDHADGTDNAARNP
jgi:hypothetical protein